MSSEGSRPLVSKLVFQNQQINGMFKQVLKELITAAFKPEALVPGIQAHNKILSFDAKWDISLKRRSKGINHGFTFEDFNNNLNDRTKDMTTSVIPWVTQMSALVANELGFQFPASLVDRASPHPRVARTRAALTMTTKTIPKEISLKSEALLHPDRAFRLACLLSPSLPSSP
ncbi:hypothetical protein BGZ47_009742 [Haplosporangium gracile]|nr:hypothetical protein BGZ47_009742 [Haplosporangium gracile]